jgi:chromosome partitioning protein
VGKSTTAVSLGAALAELGHKVLVVDLDPQGNASTGLGIRHEARDVTVYDVLAAEAPIEGAIVPTQLENLFAIPSTIDLAGAEIELVSQFSREQRLRRAIEPLRHDAFDYVFLDCPPSLGLLTVNALAAAEELIVPIQCEYYALEGLGQLLRNVRLVQQNVNTGLRLTGIVMTMFDPRTRLSDQVVQEVRKYFGDRVYRTVIPRTVRLSEAPGFGLPITSYDPTSKGAESYRELAREVHDRPADESPLPVVDEIPAVVVPPPEPVAARAPRPLVDPEAPRSSIDDEEPPPGDVDEPPQVEAIGSAEVTVEPASSPARPAGPVAEGNGSRAEGEVEPAVPAPDAEAGAWSNGEAQPQDALPRSEVEVSPDDVADAVSGDEPLHADREEPEERPNGAGKRLRGLFRRGGRS